MRDNLASERFLLTLWVGSLCAIGYLAVPMAFATLGDVTLAGNYAGELFRVVNYIGIGAGLVLIISKFVSQGKSVTKTWRFSVLLIMWFISLLFVFYLLPETDLLKHQKHLSTALSERFGLFHTLSTNIYLFLTLLGLSLVVSSDKVES